jgi:HK97 family phage prohead protease
MRWPFRSEKAEPVVSLKPRLNFSSVPTLSNFLAYVESQTISGPVTRLQALSVPAMLRGRNLICSIATLPLDSFDAEDNQIVNPLFSQFDTDVPNVVHLSQTLEDLICDGVAWWEITGFGWDGYPVNVRRVDPGLVSLDNPASTRSLSPLPSGLDPRRTYPGMSGGSVSPVIYIDGRPVPFTNIIRFDSPNPGLLIYGAQAIRRAVLLDKAAKMYAENPDAAEIIRVPDEYEDDQAQLFANNYISAKRTRAVVNLPEDVLLERPASANPAQIQLVELQRQASIEIANLLGLDPEELGVSTTSRTYSNVNDRRRDKINDVLSPYMRAITDRLSMPDVTKRGQVARFDLGDYLKANDSERWANYKTAVELGVLSPEEVRAMECIPGPVPKKPEPAPEPALDAPPTPQPQDMPMASQNSRELVSAHYADETPTRFVALNIQKFEVDTESRTITGLAVPYGNAVGNGARFEKGALKFEPSQISRIKLNMDHDSSQSIGVLTYAKDGNEGLQVKFRVARTPEGDRALTLAEDGVYDGLSVEIDPAQTFAIPDPRRKSGQLIQSAPLMGVALTPSPAFADARVAAVKFSEGEQAMPEETPVVEETAPEVTPVVAPAPATEFARPVVNPTARPVTATQVREAPVYRFNRRGALVAGTHDLAADLFAWDKLHDIAAYNRAMNFIKAQFADDPMITTDVNELNPTLNVNKYVDEKDYTYPLWTRLGRGAPPNGVQPFAWPKFSSSAIAVTTHSEGTDAFSLDYVTTSQSVTPTAKEAKVQLSREIWDMGGTPGISDLIWRKILRAWGEAREAVIDAALDAAESSPGITELATFTAGGGTDYQTLSAQMEAGLAALNFVRGGFRFEFVATQADLFAHLAAAKDDNGRPLYPILAPQNTNGTAGSRFAMINVGGVDFVPSWAAAAAGQTAAAASYLIDPTAVDAWATEPQRLDLTHTISFIEIAAWGYMAAAVNDVAGVRTITYDPVA